jgi:hypothetical protein
MGFVAEFSLCVVCGADVLSLAGDRLAMCSTHSKHDKLAALDALDKALHQKRQEIESGKD